MPYLKQPSPLRGESQAIRYRPDDSLATITLANDFRDTSETPIVT